MHTPLVLMILDGWGHSTNTENNAIAAANLPHWQQLWDNNPHTLLTTSGLAVGLPEGQMGNSEVGHLTMGSGRVVYQELTRIDRAIAEGDFAANPILQMGIKQAVATDKALHIMGLLSPGGVHSHEQHIHAVLELAAKLGARQVYMHAFLDGRDTPPKSAKASLQALDAKLNNLGCGRIASIIGRYYAMDRDNRWDRIALAYDMLTAGTAEFHSANSLSGLEDAYARGETDEFVKATLVYTAEQQPALIEDGDTVIFMNFRADRARQLTRAFTSEKFNGFTRLRQPQLANFITLTQYADDLDLPIAFPTLSLVNTLGECIACQGLHQLRIAETEKYAHVTFFFNGGREQAFSGEERLLINSPKVATYDLKPEMSAEELTHQLIQAIRSQKYQLIICNYANPDMVGHTGDFAATVLAVQMIDSCLGKVSQALKEVSGEMIITADHGNAECMRDDATGQAHTAHTSEPVPFIYSGRQAEITHSDGTLVDIAPTIMYLLGLVQPTEMTGTSIVRLS